MITAAMCARGRTLAEPRLSPDGSTLAFVASVGARAQLVTVPAEGGPELVVTADPAPARTSSYGGGVFDWALGGEALVALVRDETHSCYLGDRTLRHPWGYGCGECPACVLRRTGWEAFASVRSE